MSGFLRIGTAAFLTAAFLAAGCQQSASPTSAQLLQAKDSARDTAAANQLNREAAKLLERHDLPGAEKKLKEAIAADGFFGPAHNNLGAVYYRQRKYYLAALEFQYASNYMPQEPEPRNNLGLVYEAVGKLDDAAHAYEETLKLDPNNVCATANLARVYTRLNRRDARTRELLGQIVLRDSRRDWVAWAKERLALFDRAADSQPAPKEPATSLPSSLRP